MNTLSNLKSTVHNRKKRVGRGSGSGKGAKSGRGTTRHQAARGKIPLHFEGGQNRLVKKFPLLRGRARNKRVGTKPILISLDTLNKFKEKSLIDLDFLIREKIITQRQKKYGVKVLSNGKIEKALTVALPVSAKAKSTIEKAGGKVQ